MAKMRMETAISTVIMRITYLRYIF
jgi:hypothetical protein